MKRALLLTPLLLASCVDWNLLTPDAGEGEGDVGEGEGEGIGEGEGEGVGEGEGEGVGEGEGDVGEGEGEGDVGEGEGEGEGEAPVGPDWLPFEVPDAETVSASQGRIFVTTPTALVEFDDATDAFVPVPGLPDCGAPFRGPVHVSRTGAFVVGLDGGGVARIDGATCRPLDTTGRVGIPLAIGTNVEVDGTDTVVWDGLALQRYDAAGDATGSPIPLGPGGVPRNGRFFQQAPGNPLALLLGAPEGQIEPRARRVFVVTRDGPGLAAAPFPSDIDADIAFPDVVVVEVAATAVPGRRAACIDWSNAPQRCVDVYGREANAGSDDFFDVLAQPGPNTVLAFGPSGLLLRAQQFGPIEELSGPRGGGIDRLVPGVGGEMWAFGDGTIQYWTETSWNQHLFRDAQVAVELGARSGAVPLAERAVAFRDEAGHLRVAIDVANVGIGSPADEGAIDGVGPLGFLPEAGGGGRIVSIADGGTAGAPPRVRFLPIDAFFNAVAGDALRALDVSCADDGGCLLGHDIRAEQLAAVLAASADAVVIARCDLSAESDPLACSLSNAVNVGASVVDFGRASGFAVTLAADGSVMVNTNGLLITQPVAGGQASGNGVAGLATGTGAPLLVGDCIVLPSSSGVGFVNRGAPGSPALVRGLFSVRAAALSAQPERLVIAGGGEGGRLGAAQLAHTETLDNGCLQPTSGVAPRATDFIPVGHRRSQRDLTSGAIDQGRVFVRDAGGVVWRVP